jgi:hypothetical protein
MESSSKNWFIRVGDGINFENSFPLEIWGITDYCKTIAKNIKKNDKLWFVKNKTSKDKGNGRVIAVAEYVSMCKRDEDPRTNEDFGWRGDILYKVHRLVYYRNSIDLEKYNLYSGLKGQSSIVLYEDNMNIFEINPYTEYISIMRYLQPDEDI